ncbi:MAG: hypothetical protein H0V22_02070 [Solirubrobacterales bacterium]|nr:hypothetical protein [Solirubrobacterales bacterium]
MSRTTWIATRLPGPFVHGPPAARHPGGLMSILTIVIIVLVVLLILGVLGRGRL